MALLVKLSTARVTCSAESGGSMLSSTAKTSCKSCGHKFSLTFTHMQKEPTEEAVQEDAAHLEAGKELFRPR
jgi:hypothetical protein